MPTLLSVLLLATALLALPAHADDPLLYQLPDGRVLAFEAPASWIDEEASRPGTVAFGQRGQFMLFLTPQPNSRASAEQVGSLIGRGVGLLAGSGAQTTKVEGPQFKGYAMQTFDNSPNAEYQYIFQGGGVVEGMTVLFSLRYNEAARRSAEVAVDVLRNLRFASR